MANSFMVSADPNRYGGGQEEYVAKVQETVEKGVALLQAQQVPASHHFHTLLEQFAKARGEIAAAKQDDECYNFGRRRDETSHFNGALLTPLCDPAYAKYRGIAMSLLKGFSQGHLSSQGDHSYQVLTGSTTIGQCNFSTTFRQHTLHPFYSIPENCLSHVDYVARFYAGCVIDDKTAEITDPETLEKEIEKSAQQFRQCTQTSIYNLFLKSKSFYQKFSESHKTEQAALSEFQKIGVYLSTNRLNHLSQVEASHLLSYRHNLEIKGKNYNLSEFFTRIRFDAVNKRVSADNEVVILHTDSLVIQDLLDEAAQVFEQLLKMPVKEKSELNAFVEQLAYLEYLCAHACPFKRGSAAIEEYMTMAICRYKGLELRYREGFNVNLEALVRPFDQFLNNYPNLIEISCKNT